MEERYLQVTYQVLGAGTGWVSGVLMMITATVFGCDDLREWALVVVAAAAVLSSYCILTNSRAKLLEAIDLQLRMHDQRQTDGVSRIPTPR